MQHQYEKSARLVSNIQSESKLLLLCPNLTANDNSYFLKGAYSNQPDGKRRPCALYTNAIPEESWNRGASSSRNIGNTKDNGQNHSDELVDSRQLEERDNERGDSEQVASDSWQGIFLYRKHISVKGSGLPGYHPASSEILRSGNE